MHANWVLKEQAAGCGPGQDDTVASSCRPYNVTSTNAKEELPMSYQSSIENSACGKQKELQAQGAASWTVAKDMDGCRQAVGRPCIARACLANAPRRTPPGCSASLLRKLPKSQISRRIEGQRWEQPATAGEPQKGEPRRSCDSAFLHHSPRIPFQRNTGIRHVLRCMPMSSLTKGPLKKAAAAAAAAATSYAWKRLTWQARAALMGGSFLLGAGRRINSIRHRLTGGGSSGERGRRRLSSTASMAAASHSFGLPPAAAVALHA